MSKASPNTPRGAALSHWDAVCHGHEAVTSFLEWLYDRYWIELDYEHSKPGTPLDLRKLIDEFFEVDRRALEEDRRALLDAINTPLAAEES